MKPYNPIKVEEKIMSEPLTKDEQKFTDSFTLDKLITHEEAKDHIIVAFEEHIVLLEHHKLSTDLIKKWEKELVDYITQQEQFAKDVARYLWLLTYEYGEDYQVGKISLVEYRCLELEEEELKEKLTKGVAK